jgi:16S rRNA G966 N2-methylase RsmD
MSYAAMATINFKGKSYVQNHHLTLKYHHLVPDPAASLIDKISLHDNLIIHGDNLLALKALLPTYAGKVKCIYIDPPYNTGNEGWIYDDNVNSPMMQEWFKANSPIDKEDLARHDKWLCMTSSEDIILDSFAGSGSTAQAVLMANQNDNGSRQFILIEMENYAKSLTAERVRRVIKGVPQTKDSDLKNGLNGSFSFFELGGLIEMQAIFEEDTLPVYEDLARYVFYTATGDEFDLSKVDPDRNFIGESKDFEVYLLYQPDLNYLRSTSLDLHKAEKLGLPEPNCKKRLVFAPMKYLDADTLERYRIEYCQLPFEIYKFKE